MIDRENHKIHMVQDMCGDTGLDKMLGNRAPPEPPPPPPVEGTCAISELEDNTDYFGSDLTGYSEHTLSAEACCALCFNTEGCEAFSYVVSDGACWPKMR